MKSAFLATKSVSQLSSSSALPECATRPLAAVRPARLPTSLAPLMRRSSTALSKSPSASSSAFLQSIMPAPVRSRSCLTSAAVKLAMTLSSDRIGGGRYGLRASARGPATARSAAAARPAASAAVTRRRRPRPRPSVVVGLLLGALEQLALPLGQRLVGGDRARLRLLVGATVACRSGRSGRRRPRPRSTLVSSSAERIASSLPGIGKSTSSGSQLVSSTAITGMPSLRASSTAMCSFLVSTTQIAAGTFVHVPQTTEGAGQLDLLARQLQGLLLGVARAVPVRSPSASSSFIRCSRL